MGPLIDLDSQNDPPQLRPQWWQHGWRFRLWNLEEFFRYPLGNQSELFKITNSFCSPLTTANTAPSNQKKAFTKSWSSAGIPLWVSAVLPPTDAQPPHAKGKTPTTEVTASQLRHRKIETVKLALSFAFAVKHYLRGEDGIKYDDYFGILPSWFSHINDTGYNVERSTKSYSATHLDSNGANDASRSSTPDSKPDATKRVRVKRSKQSLTGSVSPATPLLASAHRTVEFHAYADDVSMPLPLIIATELNRLLFNFRKEGFLETIGPAGKSPLQEQMLSYNCQPLHLLVHFVDVLTEYSVSSMTDQLSAMERVANTPIPASYGIHLKQCVTLYLFALPFTLANDLGWAAVPIVTVVAFTFMGIEGIADEIEMPFGIYVASLVQGTDDHDLPIDRYCQDLKEEIDYMIERMPEGGEGLHGYDDGEGDD
ncbi:hypothetical protein H0H93_005389 [Arthromyces matolae]|nr:hypothetical protein H0H93_005389 [Arthromyces matolae]